MNSQGVYILKDTVGNALYVGQSGDIKRRIYSHMKTKAWAEEIADTHVVEIENECFRSCAERHLIRNMKPKYNKSYIDLPTSHQLSALQVVLRPHWFYDGLKAYRNFSEDQLIDYLNVTSEHILLARLGMTGPSTPEMLLVAGYLGCAICEIRFFI